MAREARFLHADSLCKAVYQASSLLAQRIDRIEVVGTKISVRAGCQRVVFEATQNETYDPVGMTPTTGGTSGEAFFGLRTKERRCGVNWSPESLAISEADL